MSEGECLICKSAPERVHQAIYTNSSWRASLSANQGYLGTLFVELLNHKSTLSDLNRLEWQDLSELIKAVESAEHDAFGAATFNWSCRLDNCYQNHPPVPHVYWHVRPRYDHDVEVEGKLMPDPNFGHHYDVDYFTHITPELKEHIADRIKAAVPKPRSKQPVPLPGARETPRPSVSRPKRPDPK